MACRVRLSSVFGLRTFDKILPDVKLLENLVRCSSFCGRPCSENDVARQFFDSYGGLLAAEL